MEFIKRKLWIKPVSGKRGSDKDTSRAKAKYSMEGSEIDTIAPSSLNLEISNYNPFTWDQQERCISHRDDLTLHNNMKTSHLSSVLDTHNRNDSKTGKRQSVKVHNRNDSKTGKRQSVKVGYDSDDKSQSEILSNDFCVLCLEEDGRSATSLPQSSNYSGERIITSGLQKRNISEENNEIELRCDLVNVSSCVGHNEECSIASEYVLISTRTGRAESDVMEALEDHDESHVTDQVTSEVILEERMHSSSDSVDSSRSAAQGSYTLWPITDNVFDIDDVNGNLPTPDGASIQMVCICENLRYCTCNSLSASSMNRKLVPLVGDLESDSLEFEVGPKLHARVNGKSSEVVYECDRIVQQSGVTSFVDEREQGQSSTCQRDMNIHERSDLYANCELDNIQSGMKTRFDENTGEETSMDASKHDTSSPSFLNEELPQRNISESKSVARGDASILHHGSSDSSCASSWNAVNASELETCHWEDASELLSASSKYRISNKNPETTFQEKQIFEMEEILSRKASSLLQEEKNIVMNTIVLDHTNPQSSQLQITRQGDPGLPAIDNNYTTDTNFKQNLIPESGSNDSSAVAVAMEKPKHLRIVRRAKDGKDSHSLSSASSNDASTSEGSASGVIGGNAAASRHVAWTLANNAVAIILLLDHKMCEGTWMKTESESREPRSSSQILPDGFSYGEEKEMIRLSTPEDTIMQVPSIPRVSPPKPGHKRSKSFGTSVSRAITDAVNKLEEMSHDSRNKQYHKLFKFVPEDECLIVSFSCALVRDILLQGRLYLSENWVCFHSNIFTFETQVSVSMEEIQNITKERTAFVVPNAIGIHTDSHKYIFGSLLSRHSTYKQLLNVWQRKYSLDETTSQDSGSRIGSEQEVIDGEDMGIDEGDAADIEEEDADIPLLTAADPHKRLPCEIHTHSQQSEFGERRPSFRRTSITTKQTKPSKLQIILAQSFTLIQAVLAINIYKSLRRFFKHEPFLALSSMIFFVLTVTAAILCYKIFTFQNQDESLLQDAYKKLSSLGNVFLSHHRESHDKVSQLQEKLVKQLQTMVHHQTGTQSNHDDEVS